MTGINETAIMRVGDGSKTLPSFSFQSDPDTGIFWKSIGSVGFSANNVEVGNWSSGGEWAFGIATTTNHTMSGLGRTVSAFTNAGHLQINDYTALAAGVGGGIAFGGIYTGSTITQDAAMIKCLKATATDGDYGFGLGFYTRANGAIMAKVGDVASTGAWTWGTYVASDATTQTHTIQHGGNTQLLIKAGSGTDKSASIGFARNNPTANDGLIGNAGATNDIITGSAIADFCVTTFGGGRRLLFSSTGTAIEGSCLAGYWAFGPTNKSINTSYADSAGNTGHAVGLGPTATTVTLTAGQYVDVTTAGAPNTSWMVFISEQSVGRGAIFGMDYASTNVVEMADPSGVFNAGTYIEVTKAAGYVFRVTGTAAVTISIFVFGAIVSSISNPT